MIEEGKSRSSWIDQRDPSLVFEAWLGKFGLSSNHVFAIREISRNLALLHAKQPLTGRNMGAFLP
jgi:hypothetical protein